MKVNQKIYNSIDTEPFEVQEINGSKVELFYLNDYDGLLEQNIAKGKFAVWTSENGYDYRLLVEKGYYEAVTRLYSKPVNQIWLEFWGDCELISKKFNRFFIMPATIVAAAAFILSAVLLTEASQKTMQNIVVFGVLVLFIIGMMTARKITNNNITKANTKSVDKIKKEIGAQTFEDLLKNQRAYMDEFFRLRNQEEFDNEETEVEEIIADDAKLDSNTPAVDADIIESDPAEEIDRKAEENRKDF